MDSAQTFREAQAEVPQTATKFVLVWILHRFSNRAAQTEAPQTAMKFVLVWILHRLSNRAAQTEVT